MLTLTPEQFSTGVRQAALARDAGVTREAVHVAQRRGALLRLPDGTIDPASARRWQERRAARTAERRFQFDGSGRRLQADLTRTVSQAQIYHRRVGRLRKKLVERDASQAEVAGLITALQAAVAAVKRKRSAFFATAASRFAHDLGDLHAEALRITRHE